MEPERILKVKRQSRNMSPWDFQPHCSFKDTTFTATEACIVRVQTCLHCFADRQCKGRRLLIRICISQNDLRSKQTE